MNIQTNKIQIIGLKTNFLVVLTSILLIFGLLTASAHCDSYDGPVIKDAVKALENNNVDLVLKWITPEQEKEITSLFRLFFTRTVHIFLNRLNINFQTEITYKL